jgi:hypothetical protein
MATPAAVVPSLTATALAQPGSTGHGHGSQHSRSSFGVTLRSRLARAGAVTDKWVAAEVHSTEIRAGQDASLALKDLGADARDTGVVPNSASDREIGRGAVAGVVVVLAVALLAQAAGRAVATRGHEVQMKQQNRAQQRRQRHLQEQRALLPPTTVELLAARPAARSPRGWAGEGAPLLGGARDSQLVLCGKGESDLDDAPQV